MKIKIALQWMTTTLPVSEDKYLAGPFRRGVDSRTYSAQAACAGLRQAQAAAPGGKACGRRSKSCKH